MPRLFLAYDSIGKRQPVIFFSFEHALVKVKYGGNTIGMLSFLTNIFGVYPESKCSHV